MFSSGVMANQMAVPRLTVKTLIAHYAGQIRAPFHEQSIDAIIKIRFAEGYLAGVAERFRFRKSFKTQLSVTPAG